MAVYRLHLLLNEFFRTEVQPVPLRGKEVSVSNEGVVLLRKIVFYLLERQSDKEEIFPSAGIRSRASKATA